jgi:glycosyltransferase involved in cell wall biosynthesis
MRLLFFDTKARNPNRYISRSIFLAIRRDPRVKEAVWASYANAVDLAQKRRFDALVAFDGEEAANAIVDRLCALIPKRAIWFTEDPYEYYRNIEVAKQFPLVFSNDAGTAKRYPNSAAHLPLAGDKDSNFLPVRMSGHRYDVFFAGSAWPNRLEFLKQLRVHNRDLRMKLILVSNGAIAPHIQKYASDFEFSDGVSIRDFCRIANQSLLTLTLPRAFSTNPLDPTLTSDTPGPRLFETALAGSCQLIDTSLTPHAGSLFERHKHFLPYQSVDDCLGAINQAVATQIDILHMAESAQQFALDHHLYDHRAEKLITALLDLATEPRSPPIQLSRPKVLFIAHNVVDNGFFGGAEIYLDFVRRLASACDVWVLVPDLSLPTRTRYMLFDADRSLRDEFTLDQPVELDHLTHPEFENKFQRLLSEYGFDILHINHLLHYPHSLPHFARAYGAKVVFTMHDYHSICENFNLLGMEHKFCEIYERPAQTCDLCLLRTRGLLPGSQSRRLRFLRESFEKIDLVLTGSRASADIFLKMFPHMREKIAELEPPMSLVPRLSGKTRSNRSRAKNSPLHVAWLGNFTVTKGADTGLAVFEALRGQPFIFHIFGRLDDIDGRFKLALEAAGNSAVVVHGKYDPGQAPPEFENCDVALFLSPFPETYCMALSEAQAFGLVPIVTAIGAPAERVVHGRNGFHVPVYNPNAVVATLEKLLKDPDLVLEMQLRQPFPAGAAPEQFVSRLESIYTELLENRARLLSVAFKRAVALDDLGVYISSPRWITKPPPRSLLMRIDNFIRDPRRLHRARLALGRAVLNLVQTLSRLMKQS